MSAFPSAPWRGLLQPAKPTTDALKCEVCHVWWVPEADCFGCPMCALSRELGEAFHNHDPA
jgi:hypothetical protein